MAEPTAAQPVSHAPLASRVTVAALLMAACILLPFGRHDDTSLLRLLIEAWHDDWLAATVLALVLAAPHAFAGTLVLASRGGAWSTAGVKAWVTLMQAELVVIGLVVLHQIPREHEMRAPWALVGFALVTAARFGHRIASPRVHASARDLRFYANWGALLVVGIFAWGELQFVDRGGAGTWLHATLAAAFVLAAVTRRRC